MVLPHARPSLLAPFLNRYFGHPVVLIHGGHPWASEAAYLASVFPMAYMDLSVMIPWTTFAVDRTLETILGQVPCSKLFHGSDEASEPEILWLAVLLCKQALERVLKRAVKRGFCDEEEALRLGRGILADNVLALHKRK